MVDKRLVIILLAILLFTGCTVNNKMNVVENTFDQVAYNNQGNVQAEEAEQPKEEEKTTKVVTTTKKVTTTKQVQTTTRVETTTAKKEVSMQEHMMNLINHERIAAGLKPVKYDYSLEKAANIRAEEMKNNNYFEHERPDGRKWYTVLDESGIKYRHAGENLARGFTSIDKAHTALMNSESHRKNILMSDYKYVAIGLAKTDIGTYYIVQIYKA